MDERHTESEPSKSSEPGEQGYSESEGLFSGSGPFIAILAVFGVIVMIAVLMAVGSPGRNMAENLPLTRYGPEDFPAVFHDDDPLEFVPETDDEAFVVPPPPFREQDIFPCSDCHEGDPGDPEPRELFYHTEIVLDHDEEHRWCMDCHLDVNRDVLHLASGVEVSFQESYLLCGQCHGTHYRDWQVGVHGRRRGFWDGPKSYSLCVHCHDSHNPRFAPMAPLPPPVAPQFVGHSAEPTDEETADESNEHSGDESGGEDVPEAL